MIPRSVDGIFPSWFKVYNSPSTIEGLRFTFYNAKLANEEASFLGKDASFCHSCGSRNLGQNLNPFNLALFTPFDRYLP